MFPLYCFEISIGKWNKSEDGVVSDFGENLNVSCG